MNKTGGNAEKTSYKYRIGFSQSLSTGVFAFEGNVQYDYPDDAETSAYLLKKMLQDTEMQFRVDGLRVASDITPKAIKEATK